MLSNGWLFQLHSSSLLLPSENMLDRKDEERIIIIIIFIHHVVRQAASALPGDFPRHIGNYMQFNAIHIDSWDILISEDIWGWLPEILTASNLFQSLFVSCFSFTWQVPGMYLARKFISTWHVFIPGTAWYVIFSWILLDPLPLICIDLSNLYVTPWQPSWSWDLPVDRCGAMWCMAQGCARKPRPFPWADFIANGPSASEIRHCWGVAYPRHLACAEPRWKELN